MAIKWSLVVFALLGCCSSPSVATSQLMFKGAAIDSSRASTSRNTPDDIALLKRHLRSNVAMATEVDSPLIEAATSISLWERLKQKLFGKEISMQTDTLRPPSKKMVKKYFAKFKLKKKTLDDLFESPAFVSWVQKVRSKLIHFDNVANRLIFLFLKNKYNALDVTLKLDNIIKGKKPVLAHEKVSSNGHVGKNIKVKRNVLGKEKLQSEDYAQELKDIARDLQDAQLAWIKDRNTNGIYFIRTVTENFNRPIDKETIDQLKEIKELYMKRYGNQIG
ncbi:unnamed protein product [Peronospora belbahrii]|uniref:RxLR effector protein n=1 Tax=Peronospora belbahrii TaxID=622444 RepID=A0AAU9LQ04_9STRA|nr:unnamed protein product [Peronospora belbahrii]